MSENKMRNKYLYRPDLKRVFGPPCFLGLKENFCFPVRIASFCPHYLFWHESLCKCFGWRLSRELLFICFACCALWIDITLIIPRRADVSMVAGIVNSCKIHRAKKWSLPSTQWQDHCYLQNILLTVMMVAESEHNFPCIHWGSYLYNSVPESMSFSFFFPISFKLFWQLCFCDEIITFVPST